jgi:phosphatidylglycerophosphatase A
MNLGQPAWARRLPTALVVGVATLGPVGQRLPAPGTFGSLAGTLLVWAAFRGVGAPLLALACVGLGYLAVGLCGEAEVRMGRRDPGEVILDEVVAMPVCFLGWELLAPAPGLETWVLLAVGFALFRFFDIVKPGFIHRLQDLPGGWGVVVDDTAAALATCLCLHAGHLAWLALHR